LRKDQRKIKDNSVKSLVEKKKRRMHGSWRETGFKRLAT
jgi:hypothetical protein